MKTAVVKLEWHTLLICSSSCLYVSWGVEEAAPALVAAAVVVDVDVVELMKTKAAF